MHNRGRKEEKRIHYLKCNYRNLLLILLTLLSAFNQISKPDKAKGGKTRHYYLKNEAIFLLGNKCILAVGERDTNLRSNA